MTPKHPTITALVVADDEVVRLGLRMLLRTMPPVRDVVEAQGRYDAVRLAETLDYDLAVLDLSRHEAARARAVIDDLASLRPDAPFVIYADDAAAAARYCREKRLLCAAASRGPSSAAELWQGVHSVLGPAAAPRGGAGAARNVGDAGLVAPLTARERKVLSLVASGQSSRQIASSLGVSVRTVESHRAGLCAKLGVRTVAALTKIAVKAGLASLDHVALR